MPDTTTPDVYEIDVPMIKEPGGRSLVPPLTANQRLHWRIVRHRTKNIRTIVANTAHDKGITKCEHLTVQLHYAPGDNRARDEDNLYPTFKTACDALARGTNKRGIGLDLVPDDTPEHMTKLAPVIHKGPGPRRLWITVKVTR